MSSRLIILEVPEIGILGSSHGPGPMLRGVLLCIFRDPAALTCT